MKDDWISPFQEKLGNYELDIPVPATRGRKLLFPLIAAVTAAAAALALLLWLPGDKTAAPAQLPQRLIAQVQPLLSESPAQLPSGHLLANAPTHRTLIPTSSTTIPSTYTHETPVTESPESPQNPDTPVQPVITHPVPVQPLFPETQDDPGQRVVRRLSVQVYTSPFPQQRNAGIVMPEPTQRISGAKANLDNWVNNSEPVVYYATSLASLRIPTVSFSDVNTHCRLPLKAGLSVRYSFSPRFQLESGLTYSYHFIEQGVPNGDTEIPFSEYHLHYVGLPVKAVVPIASGKRFHVYGSGGGEAELLAGGLRKLFVPNEEKVSIYGHPLQLSLLASAGAEITLVDRLSLYAEPGAAWHFLTPSSLPGYYRDHPLSFDLRFGLRLDL